MKLNTIIPLKWLWVALAILTLILIGILSLYLFTRPMEKTLTNSLISDE